jgi:hypothetical protein
MSFVFGSFGFGSLNDVYHMISDTFSWESYETLKEFATLLLWGEDEDPAEAAPASAEPASCESTRDANARTRTPIITVVPSASS